MREIKFALYCEIEGKWRGFGVTGIEYERYGDSEIRKIHIGDLVVRGEALRNDEAHLVQYTGLKDKNGREIYGGDILGFCDFDSLRTGGNTSDKMHMAIVKFSEGSWVVEDGGYCDYLYQVIANDSELEVIGNIYKNPELLEGK